MKLRHHLFELEKNIGFVGCVSRVWCKKSYRVIAPIVCEALFKEMAVVDERVNRQQLNACYAKRFDVIENFRCSKTGICPTQVARYRWMQFGVALNVQLINDCLVPRYRMPACPFALPGKGGIDDCAFRHERRTIALVEGCVVAHLHLVAENCRIPLQLPVMGASVRIEQKFVGIKTVACTRFVWTMHPIAVDRPRGYIWQIPMPDLVCVLGQSDPLYLLPAAFIEDTDFHLRGVS